MYWESDRDERLLSEMYGLSRLYVYPVDKPDPDADNQSYYQPDYLSENAVPVDALSVGDIFSSVDELDQEFSADDASSIGDMFSSVSSLDDRFDSYIGPSSMTGLSEDESSVGQQPKSDYEIPSSIDFNLASQQPVGVRDSRPPRGAPPQTTASQFHQRHGQFGNKPITGGGMPDMRFSSRQSDGTEFGDSLAGSEEALAIYANNLTQALSLVADVLVDHAQRIKDIEETIERSC